MAYRRFLGTLVLAASGLALSGCETMKGWREQRAAEIELEPIEADDPLSEAAEVRSPEVKGFFRPSRLRGGLSDQANEIEDHLGVP